MATQTTAVETIVETKKELKEVNDSLFIVFAEFLGYASPIVTWAEEFCKGKDIPTYKKRILKIEGMKIFKRMQEKYSLDEIRDWWDKFYTVLLEDYEDNIKTFQENENGDLPF